MNYRLSPQQIMQALQNTNRPVINNSPKVYQALKNSRSKTPCIKHGAIDRTIPGKEPIDYGTSQT